MDFKNENLKEFVSVILNKENNITEKELETFKSVNISNVNPKNGLVEYDFSELKYFSSLEKLIIRDSIISEKDIDMMVALKIRKVEFHHCLFENEKALEKLSDIVYIYFYNCYHKSFDYLEKLNKLETFFIRKPYNEIIFDFEKLSKHPQLKELTVESMNVTNDSVLKNLAPQLNRIFLLGVVLSDFTFLTNLKDNSIVMLNEEYLEEEEVKKNENRLIIYENYIPFMYDTTSIYEKETGVDD